MGTELHKHAHLSTLLEVSAINLDLQAQTRDEVLGELVQLLPDLQSRPEEQHALIRALVEREELHSTGIGDGIALPHTRNTLGGLATRPAIAVGRHRGGVAFGAIDGRPAHLFILLLAPSITEHLHLLAKLSRLLREASLREALLAAPSPAAVIDLIRQAEPS